MSANVAATPESSEAAQTKEELRRPYAALAGGVIAGSKVGGDQPKYPEAARVDHIQGAVILMAMISPAGKITNVVRLASPDQSLTQAAMNAVKTWTYKPYLLYGKPVEVHTTITVNFNLSR